MFRIQCELIIGDLRNIFIELILVKGDPDLKYAFEAYIATLDLEKILQAFLSNSLVSIPWLKRLKGSKLIVKLLLLMISIEYTTFFATAFYSFFLAFL